MDIESLAVRFTTEGDAQLRAALNDANKGTDELTSKLVHLGEVLLTAEFWKRTIEKSTEMAVSLDILSKKTGETIENLSRLQYAAEASHVGTDALNVGIRGLVQSIQEAQTGTGNLATVFKAIGVNVSEQRVQQVGLKGVLEDVADRFSKYADGQGKAALAIDVFKRSGLDMLPLLNQGRDGIRALANEADKLGGTMSEATAKSLLDYHESMKRLGTVLTSLGESIAVAVVPSLERLNNDLVATKPNAIAIQETFFAIERTGRFIANVFIELASTIESIMFGLEGMGRIILDVVNRNWVQLGIDVDKTGNKLQDLWDDEEDRVWKNRLAMMGLGDATKEATKAVEDHHKKANAPTIRPPSIVDRFGPAEAAAKASLDYQLELVHDNLDAQRALWMAWLDEQSAIYGTNSKEYLEAMKEIARIDNESKDEREKNAHDMNEALKRWDEEGLAYERSVLEKKVEAAKEYADATVNIISGVFTAGFKKGGGIGAALQALGDGVLQGLGGIFMRMGTAMVEASPIFQAVRAGLTNFFTAPEALLIGGVALVALGATLNAIGSGAGGGGGGGGGGSAYTSQPPATYQQVVWGPNSATSAAGMPPQQNVNVTVIGPNDPTAQRQIKELIANADRRNG